MSGAGIWTVEERAAWLPPERLGAVAWPEKHRILSATTAAEPGRLRWDRTPWFRGMCEAILDNSVQEVVFLKPTQVGYSEWCRSILGYWIDEDPGPCMMVMPSEESARETVDERIRPLIECTPQVARHLSPNPDDFTKRSIKFDTMQLFMGWAGSAQALATRPCRYVILDETDKYPPYTGKEADPISLAKERTYTFGYRKKIIQGSTPTLRTGAIWRAFEACGDQRCLFVPCPHCRHFQRLVWTQLKFGDGGKEENKARRAAGIELHRSAYYECESCKGKIEEQHKAKMCNAGLWVSGSLRDGIWAPIQKIADGKLVGPRPQASRVGFWINSLYSPWKSFSDVAAEGVRSMGDYARMQNFKNSWLAEPYEEQVASVKVGDFQILRSTAPKAKIIPAWASYVIATADVQQEGDLCYFVVRAWGANYKSQLIDFGTVPGVEALSIILERQYETLIPGVERTTPDQLLIDAGYVPNRVYQFATTDARIKACIGARNHPKRPITFAVGSRELGVERCDIDTNYFKDQLHARRNTTGLWLLNDAITDDYCRQLAAEHKILDRKSGRMMWVPVSSGSANHYLDCEVYQMSAADIVGVNELEQPKPAPRDGEENITEEEPISLGIF